MRRDLLSKVTSGDTLNRQEAFEVGRDLAAGRFEPIAIAAFLGALAARGEKPDEIVGLASAFRQAVSPFPTHTDAVDTCGTGGDGSHTFNLSTAAALTAAAMGVTVAKHGNRSISSACGSADILEYLGYPIHEEADKAAARLRNYGFAFLFAPKYHPAMIHVAPLRKTMGVRTVFNLLGPLLNPAGVKRQVVGVFDMDRMEIMAESLRALQAERALVIHSDGGYDEAVLFGITHVIDITDEKIERYDLTFGDFGFAEGRPEDLHGGGVHQNATALAALLQGQATPGLRNAVAANTALTLRAAGVCENLKEGAQTALQTIESGIVGWFFQEMLQQAPAEKHCA